MSTCNCHLSMPQMESHYCGSSHGTIHHSCHRQSFSHHLQANSRYSKVLLIFLFAFCRYVKMGSDLCLKSYCFSLSHLWAYTYPLIAIYAYTNSLSSLYLKLIMHWQNFVSSSYTSVTHFLTMTYFSCLNTAWTTIPGLPNIKFLILQVIKKWTVERPGNDWGLESNHSHSFSVSV